MPSGIGNKMRRFGHLGIMKYAHCETTADVRAINPAPWHELTDDYKFIFEMPNLKTDVGTFDPNTKPVNYTQGQEFHMTAEFPLLESSKNGFCVNPHKISTYDLKLPKITYMQSSFWGGWSPKEINIEVPSLVEAYSLISLATVYEWESDFPVLVKGDKLLGDCSSLRRIKSYMPLLETAHNLCNNDKALTSFECDLPSLKDASMAFGACILDKVSALRILNSIPAWSDNKQHRLTMGIHIDHKNDEEIATAITNATNRGWTITTQWNGTATAASYSLRPREVSTGVYAKTFTYNDHDDNEITELDWCHEVSDANYSEPEELGYMYFDSLDLAYEYFGLENKN